MAERDVRREVLKENFVSIDIESSGPIPGEYSMLSLGANLIANPNETFYATFKPISDNFVPEALTISGFTLEELRETGTDPEQAMTDFEEWLKNNSKEGRPIATGFNMSFDWQFINYYFHRFLKRNPLGINALDLKGYYMGKFDTRWSETSKQRMDERFKGPNPHTHNALDDAIEQGELFYNIKAHPGHSLK
jgi:DNA polymerase III epsilon subunit-like protein